MGFFEVAPIAGEKRKAVYYGSRRNQQVYIIKCYITNLIYVKQNLRETAGQRRTAFRNGRIGAAGPP